MEKFKKKCQAIVEIIREVYSFINHYKSLYDKIISVILFKKYFLRQKILKMVRILPVEDLTIFFYPDSSFFMRFTCGLKVLELSINNEYCVYTFANHKVIGFKCDQLFWDINIWKISNFIVRDLI